MASNQTIVIDLLDCFDVPDKPSQVLSTLGGGGGGGGVYATSSSSSSLSSSATAANATTTTTTTAAAHVEDEELQLFSMYSQIVGKRFYSGKFNPNEIIYLEREPRNPYDGNAIKVLSITKQPVGHVRAASQYPNHAAILSKIVDKHKCSLEAVSTEVGNSYKSEIEITIVGVEEQRDQVFKLLKTNNMSFFDIRNNSSVNGYSKHETSVQRGPSSSSNSASSPGSRVQGGAGGGGGGGDMASYYKFQEKILSEEELIRNLDSVWYKNKLDFTSSQAQMALYYDNVLKNVLKTKLYPHQIQALSWMLMKETVDDTASTSASTLPPFWSFEPSTKTYLNCITNHSHFSKPRNVLGGMLCDDMGLGKSLSTIALILSNSNAKFKIPVSVVSVGRS